MAYRTISIMGPARQREFKAGGAITPGHLVEVSSTAGDVVVHSTAGGTAIAMFALEDEGQGKTITQAYADNNEVRCGVFGPGDEVYAILADGENASVGSFLESAGDGTLRVVDADASVGDIGVQSVVGIALEAVDMSGSSGADPSGRIQTMIL